MTSADWSDEEIRELFDDWFEKAVDEGRADDRHYSMMLRAYIAGFRAALEQQ